MLAQEAAALFAEGHGAAWISISPRSPLRGLMTEGQVIGAAMSVLDLIHCKDCGWLIKRKDGPLCEECELLRGGQRSVA